MKVTVDGLVYRMSFRHIRTVDGPNMTQCRIVVENPDGTEGFFCSGTATCRKGDQFCKETGRKIALKRALESGIGKGRLFKRERALFWRAYHARTGATASDQAKNAGA